jgi:hypothetical protein
MARCRRSMVACNQQPAGMTKADEADVARL